MRSRFRFTSYHQNFDGPELNQLWNYKFCLQQLVFWDETHKDILYHTGDEQIRILRDRDEKVDLVNGKLANEEFALKTKYTKQTRLLVGVAKVELPDGTIVGRRCEAYQYDDCWVHTITDSTCRDR